MKYSINYDKFRAVYSESESGSTEEEIAQAYGWYRDMIPFFVRIYEQGLAGEPLEDFLFWLEVSDEY